MESDSKLICGICQKKFGSVSTKNRHLKTIHHSKVDEKKYQHIRCPLCPEEKKETLGTHDSLLNHLSQVHSVSIKQSNLNFRNVEEFEAWRAKEYREVDYACYNRKKSSNGDLNIQYNCNRSNTYGFRSNCTKRAMKTAGSIRISGICPSRILVKIFENGMVNVRFIETHVGHQDELRTKRLMKQEQAMIVEQLNAGVTNERILQDARKIKNSQLERINLITRGDLGYLVRKFNIDKKLERPTANNYQHKITVKAHAKAEEMKDFVESVEFGEFKVKSSTGEKFYIVSYNVLSDEDCRRAYCDDCKICVHRYNCNCPKFAVKTALCKHIHAVVLYERWMSESVSGVLNTGNFGEENLEEPLYIQEPTTSKMRYQDELCQYLEEKSENETGKSISLERKHKIILEEVFNYTKNLDEELLDKFTTIFRTFKNNVEREKTNEICKKRKIEKQMYYPNKK